MASIEEARHQIEDGWNAVTRIWLDDNASSIERGSIKPMLEMLKTARAFNEEHQAQAQEFAAQAAEIPMDR